MKDPKYLKKIVTTGTMRVPAGPRKRGATVPNKLPSGSYYDNGTHYTPFQKDKLERRRTTQVHARPGNPTPHRKLHVPQGAPKLKRPRDPQPGSGASDWTKRVWNGPRGDPFRSF